MNNDEYEQENAYHETRRAAEEILGIDITVEQWNKFFFENMIPYITEARILREQQARTNNILKAFKSLLQ